MGFILQSPLFQPPAFLVKECLAFRTKSRLLLEAVVMLRIVHYAAAYFAVVKAESMSQFMHGKFLQVVLTSRMYSERRNHTYSAAHKAQSQYSEIGLSVIGSADVPRCDC